MDVAPASREGELAVGRERLAAEEDDEIVEQGPADLAHHLLVEVA